MRLVVVVFVLSSLSQNAERLTMFNAVVCVIMVGRRHSFLLITLASFDGFFALARV
jgi:hypothetical protein